MYATADVRAFAQLMYRSARRATLFVWNIDTSDVAVPVTELFVGLSSICRDASRLASTVTWPASASSTAIALTAMTRLPAPDWLAAYCEVITGIPSRVPPLMVNPGNSDWPSELRWMDSPSASAVGMIRTRLDGSLFSSRNSRINRAKSERAASAVTPDGASGVTPFVIDAGLTPDTAATVGSMKSVSMRATFACTSPSRIRASAEGDENRINSSVMTEIDATFVNPSVVALTSNLVSGFGAPCPTQ